MIRDMNANVLRLSAIIMLACLGGCGREEGLVVTHDGRLVTETPEIANREFSHRLAQRAADIAGNNWKATTVIDETPVMHLVKADEYGWKTLNIHLTLVPPRGVASDAGVVSRVEAAVRDMAHYRVPRSDAIHLQTVVVEAGAPLPGSQHYTSVAGDTWAGISTAFYGTTQHWRLIADANPGVDAAPLPAGSALVIPPKP